MDLFHGEGEPGNEGSLGHVVLTARGLPSVNNKLKGCV